jgi:hypothetical protein
LGRPSLVTLPGLRLLEHVAGCDRTRILTSSRHWH